MPNLSPDLMVFAKFKFSQPSYRYGDEVIVNLDIRNNSPVDISIDKISGSFNMTNFNQEKYDLCFYSLSQCNYIFYLDFFYIFEKIIAISEPISIAPESTKSIQFKLKANSDLSGPET